mmetsp:Transcript_20800/g.52404  ORF Transcript_20800/g.52404 Transcript_20800/m.52404 type:complete len:217 (+) Transcript_20800:1993-2643(+)
MLELAAPETARSEAAHGEPPVENKVLHHVLNVGLLRPAIQPMEDDQEGKLFVVTSFIPLVLSCFNIIILVEVVRALRLPTAILFLDLAQETAILGRKHEVDGQRLLRRQFLVGWFRGDPNPHPRIVGHGSLGVAQIRHDAAHVAGMRAGKKAINPLHPPWLVVFCIVRYAPVADYGCYLGANVAALLVRVGRCFRVGRRSWSICSSAGHIRSSCSN